MKIREQRLELIINLLQIEEASFEEIAKYLNQKDSTIEITRRTFQRDIKEIYDKFHLKIKASRKNQNYYLQTTTDASKKAVESYNILTLLNIGEKYDFIKPEKVNSDGTQLIPIVIKAIENKQIIKIIYNEYWEINRKDFTIEPLALKEFKRRWYLIARDTRKTVKKPIKNFEISRIKKIEITNLFYQEIEFNIEEHFKNYYGIRTDNEPFEEVILSVEPLHAKYIKAVPLHDSQELLIDNEDEVLIRLKLHITFDFIQELLASSYKIKVVAPANLQKIIKKHLRETLEHYK